YQPSKNNRKGLFSLDNLWDGLGAFVLLNPQIKYLFGKVTMYPHFNPEARDLIMYFLNHYFPDKDKLITAKNELKYKTDICAIQGMFDGLDYKQGYKLLNSKVREMGENIPPLVNTYMNLSPSMRVFGTAINQDFGDVEETGILIVLDDIYPAKKERHMSTFERDRHFGQPAKKLNHPFSVINVTIASNWSVYLLIRSCFIYFKRSLALLVNVKRVLRDI